MNKFVLIFGVLITITAFVQAKPREYVKPGTFEFKEEFEDSREVIQPPPRIKFPSGFCFDEEEVCAQKTALQDANNNKIKLDGLNKWIDGLSTYGKANWRKEFPDTAKDYDSLQKSS